MVSINLILYVGIALILGYYLGKITNWLKLTEIVGYIIAGIILGPIIYIITSNINYFFYINIFFHQSF